MRRRLAALALALGLPALAQAAHTRRTERLPGRHGAAGAEVAAEEALVRFDEKVDEASRTVALERAGLRSHHRIGKSRWHLVRMRSGMKVADGLAVLKSLPGVVESAPNHLLHPLTIPNDPLVAQQWYLSHTSAFAGWSHETGASNSVVIAVIDEGIQADHEDLADKRLTAYDQDCSAGACIAETETPCGSHGTLVAGVAAAATNNSAGIAGTSWGAKLVSLRIFSGTDCSGGGTDADVIAALDYAATTLTAASLGPVVVNMSIGGSNACSPAMQDAVTAAVTAGVTLVAAAGNEQQTACISGGGSQDVEEPASCSGVIPVGATDLNDTVTAYSCQGPTLAQNGLVAPGGSNAPGGGIETTDLGGGYTTISGGGTSLSCALVSGLAALVLSANPSLTPAQVQTTLRNSASNIGAAADAGGAGLANVYSALNLTLNGTAATDLGNLTPSYPANGAYVDVQPNLTWLGPSPTTVSGLPAGALYYLQVSNNDPAFASGNLVLTASIPPVIAGPSILRVVGAYTPSVTLVNNATYYWRVALTDAQSETLGPWSRTFSFVTDLAAPAQTASFASLNSAANPLAESQINDRAAGVTARLEIQDTLSGLGVSSGFGVLYSTDAGQTWTDGANVISNVGTSLHSLAAFGGALYATGDGSVYSSANGTSWSGTTVGTNPLPLVVFNGALYTGDSGGNVYSTTDGTTWNPAVNVGANGILSLAVFNGYLYAGDSAGSRRRRLLGRRDAGRNEHRRPGRLQRQGLCRSRQRQGLCHRRRHLLGWGDAGRNEHRRLGRLHRQALRRRRQREPLPNGGRQQLDPSEQRRAPRREHRRLGGVQRHALRRRQRQWQGLPDHSHRREPGRDRRHDRSPDPLRDGADARRFDQRPHLRRRLAVRCDQPSHLHRERPRR
ncbi:MAG: S8 family serine peptidase [Elusimicrobia bacterium]|nr:S8 family serine peptidase [Elusimicrobiota bacterium]